MNILAFLGALALSVFAFELASALSGGLIRRNRLAGVQNGQTTTTAPASGPSRTAWYAILVAALPSRFDPKAAKTLPDVISLLRRAGYPYDTPGEFYAAAVRTFSLYLAIAGLVAGLMVSLGMIPAGMALAALFIFLGLRRPYVRLKLLAKKRAEALCSNMLTGLAMLHALMSAGVGVQEALRRTAGVGGPFCNLLGLLNARMEVDDFHKALAVTRAHLPDAQDVEAGLFLRDVEAFFVHNRPLLPGVQALHRATHRNVVEATEARAALVRQRSGLFGVLAVMGLVISIIAPFAGILF